MKIFNLKIRDPEVNRKPVATQVMATEELHDTFPPVDTGNIDLHSVTALVHEVADKAGMNKFKALSTVGTHHHDLAQSRTGESGRAVVAIRKAAEDELKVVQSDAVRAQSERDKHDKHKLVQVDNQVAMPFADRVKVSIICMGIIALIVWGILANSSYLLGSAISSGWKAVLIGCIPVLAGKVFAVAIERGIGGDRAIKTAMLCSGIAILLAALVWGFTIGSEGGMNNGTAVAQAADPLGLGGSAIPATSSPTASTFTSENRGILRMISQIIIEVLGSFILFFMLSELLAKTGAKFVKLSVVAPCPLYAAHDADFASLTEKANRLTQVVALCDEWEKSRSDAIKDFVAKAQAAFLNNLSAINFK